MGWLYVESEPKQNLTKKCAHKIAGSMQETIKQKKRKKYYHKKAYNYLYHST